MTTVLALIIVGALFFPELILALIGLFIPITSQKERRELEQEKIKYDEQKRRDRLEKELNMENPEN